MSTAGRWRVVPVAVVATLGLLTVASACSNDDGGGDASDGSVTAPAGGETSSTPPGSDGTSTSPTGPQAYAGRGPYPVGTLEIDAPNGPITVWYPGEPGSEAGAQPATYDMRTYLPPARAGQGRRGQRHRLHHGRVHRPAGGGAREPAVPARAVQPRLLRLSPAVVVPHHRHGLVGLHRRRPRALGPRPDLLPGGHHRPGRQHRRGRPAGGHPRDGGGEPARRRCPRHAGWTPAASPWSATRRAEPQRSR